MKMTADNAFYAFSSISLAAILLAFIIGFRDMHPRDSLQLLRSFILQRGSAQKALKHQQLDRKTQIADEAMAAKERGERFVPPADYRGF